MNKLLDIYIKGRRYRTFEGDLSLTIVKLGKETSIPLKERTKRRINKLNPERKEKDGYVIINDSDAILLAAKDTGLLKKVSRAVGIASASVTVGIGLAAFLNFTNADISNENNEEIVETIEDTTENETHDIDYSLSHTNEDKNIFESIETKEEPIETMNISYEHEVPPYIPIEVSEPTIEETTTIEEPSINDSTSNIYDDYYYVYENTRNEAPFGEKENVKKQFGTIIENYSSDYGLDPELYLALLCQENGLNLSEEEIIEYRKKNGTYDGEVHAVGIAQIAKSNDGHILYCHNRNTNKIDSEIIDIERCANDVDYCIKIGAMALSDSINCSLRNKNPIKTNEEAVIYGIVGYFKGPDVAIALSNNNKSFEQNKLYIENECGDYVNRVLRTVNDGKGIYYITPEGKEISFVVDNINDNMYDYHYDTNAKKL